MVCKEHGEKMNCFKKKGNTDGNGVLHVVIALWLTVLAGCAASVIPDKNNKDKITEYSGYLSEHERVVEMLSDKVDSLSGVDAVALASVLTVAPPKGYETPFSRVGKFIVYSSGQNAQTDTEVDEGTTLRMEKDNVDNNSSTVEAGIIDSKSNPDTVPVKTIWPEYKKK